MKWFYTVIAIMASFAVGTMAGGEMGTKIVNDKVWRAMDVAPPSQADCGGSKPAEVLLIAVTGKEVGNLCAFRPTAPGKTLPTRFQPPAAPAG